MELSWPALQALWREAEADCAAQTRLTLRALLTSMSTLSTSGAAIVRTFEGELDVLEDGDPAAPLPVQDAKANRAALVADLMAMGATRN